MHTPHGFVSRGFRSQTAAQANLDADIRQTAGDRDADVASGCQRAADRLTNTADNPHTAKDEGISRVDRDVGPNPRKACCTVYRDRGSSQQ